MTALILVDLQNDFVPGGALPVPRGDEVVDVANRLMPCFELVVATKDWHPTDHGSFASRHPGRNIGEIITLNGLPQVLWPEHCVQGTHGAEFLPGLNVQGIHKVFTKGSERGTDSYSGFFDNGHRKATGLDAFLEGKGVTDVYILGLATDYCAKFTALDARALGLNTYVVEDGCRGVELNKGDITKATDEMKAAGVRLVRASDITAAERQARTKAA
jgi:nicotinamidase/pyrazinamidase